MTKENLVHVKFDFNEAINGKKELLFSEMNLLKIRKRLDNYRKLRTEELKQKEEFLKNLKELNSSIRKIKNSIFPKIQVPETIKKDEKVSKKTSKKKTTKDNYKRDDIESQLKDIQEQIKKLSA